MSEAMRCGSRFLAFPLCFLLLTSGAAGGRAVNPPLSGIVAQARLPGKASMHGALECSRLFPAIDRTPIRALTHVVAGGETLSEVAESYGSDVETLAHANGIRNPDVLAAGDRIIVLTGKGVIHTVARGESLSIISLAYQVPIGEIAIANHLLVRGSLTPGATLIIPGASPPRPASQRNSRSLASRSSPSRDLPAVGLLRWPLQGEITSDFGRRRGRLHCGIDIAAEPGRCVAAAASGEVTYAGRRGGYGLLVVIDHGGGLETWYGHNSKVLAGAGSQVAAGQPISVLGSTGRSTGPHLHFEVRTNGRPQNPLRFLP
ncbi:MAG: M23 family metallopeptidase [Bacillota bacterium]